MLSIIKRPQYLSPSSLKVYERMPNKFYLNRMAPNPLPYDPQGPAAGVGSAFDAYVKLYLVRENAVKCDESILRERMLKDMWGDSLTSLREAPIEELMLNSQVDEANRIECIPMGKVLFDTYRRNGLSSIEWVDIEQHFRHTLLSGVPGHIPLFMKLDASIMDPDRKYDRSIPFDWKVTGYGSATGVSPKKGYVQLFDGGIPKGCHKDYRVDCPMQEIDSDWAAQTCTYGWGLGIPFGEPFPVVIDNIVIRPNGIRVARYRGIITKSYQVELSDRYNAAWNGLMTGEILKRIPEHRKFCELYAQFEKWWS